MGPTIMTELIMASLIYLAELSLFLQLLSENLENLNFFSAANNLSIENHCKINF